MYPVCVHVCLCSLICYAETYTLLRVTFKEREGVFGPLILS